MKASESEFRAFVEDHKAMVFSIALRIIGDRGAAEEVAQDVFLKLHFTLKRLDSADHVRFWLRRVAVHRATDYLRRRARRPEFGADEWQDEIHGACQTGADMNETLETRLERILLSLPEALRGAAVLRYQEDLEMDEIAQVLGQPLATVKSNLQRALELLRRKGGVVLKEFIRE